MISTRAKSVAVLAFHKIGLSPAGSSPTWFYISEESFAKQLTVLKEEAWSVIDLQRFLRGLDNPDTLPDRSALITFDDACQSMTDVALKYLRQFDFPAVVFVASDYIGKNNAFDFGIEPEEAICTWNDLKLLDQAGISVQSHSASHAKFSDLNCAAQAGEIIHSKAALEKNLGRSVTALAYPYGDSGRDHVALAGSLNKAGYHAAFLYGGGIINPAHVDRFQIPRIAMGPDTDLRAEFSRQPTRLS